MILDIRNFYHDGNHISPRHLTNLCVAARGTHTAVLLRNLSGNATRAQRGLQPRRHAKG